MQCNSCSKSVGIEANPIHVPNPLGSKPIQFMFQIRWLRMQSNSCSKSVGFECNPIHAPPGPPGPVLLVWSTWSGPPGLVLLVWSSWSESPGLANQIHFPNQLGPKPTQFTFQIRWFRSHSNSCSKSVGFEANPIHSPNPLEYYGDYYYDDDYNDDDLDDDDDYYYYYYTITPPRNLTNFEGTQIKT